MDRPFITVSTHAIQRYRERIAEVGDDAIMAVLAGDAVRCAARFGARVVRISKGRILLEHRPYGVVVMTVVPINDRFPFQLLPSASGGPMPIAHERALFQQPGERP